MKEKLHKVDTRHMPDGRCHHGYPIDFWDDEVEPEAPVTKLEICAACGIVGILLGLSAYYFFY